MREYMIERTGKPTDNVAQIKLNDVHTRMDLGPGDPLLGSSGEPWRYSPAIPSFLKVVPPLKRDSEPNDGYCLCSHRDHKARHCGRVHFHASWCLHGECRISVPFATLRPTHPLHLGNRVVG
jgi:hypothetical protein